MSGCGLDLEGYIVGCYVLGAAYEEHDGDVANTHSTEYELALVARYCNLLSQRSTPFAGLLPLLALVSSVRRSLASPTYQSTKGSWGHPYTGTPVSRPDSPSPRVRPSPSRR